MNETPLLNLIKNVLQENKDKQINLNSHAACQKVATQVATALLGKYHLIAHRNSDDIK